MTQKIRVMLVDDSAVIRGLYARALSNDATIEISSTASNGSMAIDMLKRNPADVMVLDIEMPEMDGLQALPKILEVAPQTRIIMASTLTLRNAESSLRAMDLGASDYIAKPSSRDGAEVEEFYRTLLTKIKALAPRHYAPAAPKPAPTVFRESDHKVLSSVAAPAIPVKQSVMPQPAGALAIASSTGGPQALLHIFRQFKGQRPRTPIFITQHMPSNFTAILADHIHKACDIECTEGIEGEVVKPNKIYIAPGDFHMTVRKDGGQIRIHLDQNPPENFCRPSADPMLRSLAQIYGSRMLVAVLTGLGADGARGAAEIVATGGCVIAQDEATSVVYGMPKAVADAKLTSAIFPLENIAPYLIKAVT